MLNYIASCLDTDKFSCYVDIPGHQTPAGGTLPPNVAVSTLKPDIVVVDKQKKSVDIFELTYPAEHRIETANSHRTTTTLRQISCITNPQLFLLKLGHILDILRELIRQG